jgi:2-hydroxychromene-2-carboxylate isomerase
MAELQTVAVYTDYKSPYAYLAKDLVYELARDFPVRIDWLPYRLDIPSFLGSARLDGSGRVVEEQRNAHQWRRVRYSYMDCRRHARKRGLVIRGTQKIWDSTLTLNGCCTRSARVTRSSAAITTRSSSASGSASSTSRMSA